MQGRLFFGAPKLYLIILTAIPFEHPWAHAIQPRLFTGRNVKDAEKSQAIALYIEGEKAHHLGIKRLTNGAVGAIVD